MAQKKKPVRRNVYRNGVAGRRVARAARFSAAVKAAIGIATLAAASFALIFGYDYLTQCTYFEARQLRVMGQERLSEADILARARLQKGVNILSVNLFLVRQQLLADPWIEEAQVSRDLPDAVEIRIEEQKPLAVLDLGRKFLLNERGEVFMELAGDDLASLPLVTGLAFPDIRLPGDRGSPVFEAVLEVLRLGSRDDAAVPLGAVRRIEVDRQLGLSLHAFGGAKIIKIGFDDYPDKYDRLRKVMGFLGRDGRLPDFSVIDLNNRNRIVVTPAQASAPEAEPEEV